MTFLINLQILKMDLEIGKIAHNIGMIVTLAHSVVYFKKLFKNIPLLLQN